MVLSENQTLVQAVETLRSSSDDLKQKNSVCEDQLVQLSQIIKTLEEEIESNGNIANEFQELEQLVISLRKENFAFIQTIKTLEAENKEFSNLKSIIVELENELETEKNLNIEFRSQIDSLRANWDMAETKI